MAKPVINIKFFADLKQFSTQMQNAERSLDRTGKRMQRTGQSLSLALTAPLLGIGGLAVKAAADFEVLGTSLTTAFNGNEQAAKAAQRQIETFAGKTPFQLEEVTSAFIKLKNLGLDPSERALTSYGNTAAAMGKSLDQVIEAVADAATGEFERLKEFGIKAKQQGDQVRFTFRGVETTVRKDAQSIQQFLLNIGETDFAGGIERQAETFNGRLSTLRDNASLLAAEFGNVIIEGLNPLIDALGDAAQDFRGLDDDTKKVIVTAAAFAAAAGPAVVVVGTLTRNVSALIPVVRSLTVAIAANPIGALAVAITAVAGSVLLANSRLGSLTDATEEYNNITVTATKNIAKEKSELERYLATAKNDALSKEERQKAIERLNALSPEYLGNLTLENINTEKAAIATQKYVDALLLKAKVIAAEEKLVEVQRELLELQLGTNDAVKPSIWQNLTNAVTSFGNSAAFGAATIETISNNIGQEQTALTELQGKLTEFLQENESLISSNTRVADSFKNVTSAASGSGFSTPQVEVVGSLNPFVGLDPSTQLAESATAALQELNNTSLENAREELRLYQEEQQRLQDMAQAVGGAIQGAFDSMASGIVSGLGKAESGLGRFAQALAATALKIISVLLSQSIASSISNATQSAAGTGPAAIFTQPAFIATLVSGVLGAFAAIPKFATGGVVPGGSTVGDKILARVNSGELILNADQQTRLLGLLDMGGRVVQVPYIASTEVAGENLRIVLTEYDKNSSRNG